MTRQEIFDKVVLHAHQQNRKSVAGVPEGGIGGIEEKCLYRGPEGTKCFVGALIPDELYHPRLESHGVFSNDVRQVLTEAGVIPEAFGVGDPSFSNIDAIGFLREIQLIHDNMFVTSWPRHFQNLATKHGLTYNPPPEPANERQ